MIPKVETIGVLVNPTYPAADSQIRDVGEAATSLRVQLVIVRANKENEFDAAFSTVVAQRAGALLVCASPFFNATASSSYFWLLAMGFQLFSNGVIMPPLVAS